MKIKEFTVIFFITIFSQYNISQNFGWQLKKTGLVTGDPIFTDRANQIVFLGVDSLIYYSSLSCSQFYKYGNPVPEIKQIKSIFRSSVHPNEFLIAGQISSSSTGRINKSYDNCQSWNHIADCVFSYFGIPVTQDYNNPDILYTINGSTFQKSTDFGSSWIDISFNLPCPTPCDIEVFKDSSNIILVGDNGTGIFRSSDYGLTWTQTFSTSGEIPVLAIKKTFNNEAFATRWGGSGTDRVVKSTDHGLTWSQVDGPFAQVNIPTWGIDIYENDSSHIAIGEFSPWGRIYISSDYGNTWNNIPNSNDPTNYALEFISDSVLLSASGTGLFKLRPIPITTESTIKLVFTVDINQAVDFNTKKRIDTLANCVWIKGSLTLLGNNIGEWTFNDTLNNTLVAFRDDGRGYDSIANDNVWTLCLEVPPGELVGEFSYRYGISYNGVDTVNNGIAYLNNDNPVTIRTYNFQETDTLFILNRDYWNYKIQPIIVVSDSIINFELTLNDSAAYQLTISNEQGSDTLIYTLSIISDSLMNSFYGYNTNSFINQNKIYGNVFYTDRLIKIEHFEQYLNTPSASLISFLIYEAENNQGIFRNIFKRNRLISAGTGFKSSNPINLYLNPHRYYLIGLSCISSVELFRGLNPNNLKFAKEIGSTIQDFISAPSDTININTLDTLIFYQNIYHSVPSDWITPVFFENSIAESGVDNLSFSFNSFANPVGNYRASMFVISNDLENDTILIPIIFKIKNPSNVSSEITFPHEFNLFQNYPNPFNPSTKISWLSPVSGHQTLKVYDVLGREVATLVDEFRNAGSYEVEFKSSVGSLQLASGVYYYQLRVGNFIQAKKMLLLK